MVLPFMANEVVLGDSVVGQAFRNLNVNVVGQSLQPFK